MYPNRIEARGHVATRWTSGDLPERSAEGSGFEGWWDFRAGVTDRAPRGCSRVLSRAVHDRSTGAEGTRMRSAIPSVVFRHRTSSGPTLWCPPLHRST